MTITASISARPNALSTNANVSASTSAIPALPRSAFKPALTLSLCLYGALALGAYQLLAKPQADVTPLSLGSATIDLDLGQFGEHAVTPPAPEPAPEPEQKITPESEPEPTPPKPEPEPEPEPVIPEPQVQPQPQEQFAPPAPQVKPRERQHRPREARPRHEQHRPQRHQRPQQQRANEHKQQAQTAAPSTATQTTTKASSPKSSAGSANRVLILGKDQHPVLLRIKRAIDQNLLYPRKARMMRMEGIAVVQFTYTTNRQLHNIRLLKGTGHSVLDQAAIQSIQRAAAAFPKVEHNFTLRLPIRFNLR